MDEQSVVRTQDAAGLVADLGAHLWDVPTVLVVGNRTRQSPAIATVLDALQRRLTHTTLAVVAGSVPHLAEFTDWPRATQVIALGGGKVMDVAKMISLGVAPRALAAALVRGQTALPRNARLICCPTTAGSGSEATHFAVCYFDDKKYSIAHPSLRPDVVALCPELLRSASTAQITVSGLDAVAQAIEGLFSRDVPETAVDTARTSLALSLPALRRIAAGDISRGVLVDLQYAAYLSGRVIDRTKTNLPHSLSYVLTMQFDVPHGLAVTLFFEAYLRLLDDAFDDMTEAQKANFSLVCQAICDSDRYVPGAWKKLMASLSQPGSVRELGVAVSAAQIRRSVNAERLGNFALPLDFPAFLDAALT